MVQLDRKVVQPCPARFWPSPSLFSALPPRIQPGPQPPQPGTPAFYLAAAKSTFAAGDFLKASDNLSQINSSAEFGARPVRGPSPMSAGLAKGYMDLADNFELGARANRANPAPFRRQLQQLRSGRQRAMQCAESTDKLLAENKDATIAFEFPFPTGSAAEPVQLQRVSKGMIVPASEVKISRRPWCNAGCFSQSHAWWARMTTWRRRSKPLRAAT